MRRRFRIEIEYLAYYIVVYILVLLVTVDSLILTKPTHFCQRKILFSSSFRAAASTRVGPKTHGMHIKMLQIHQGILCQNPET